MTIFFCTLLLTSFFFFNFSWPALLCPDISVTFLRNRVACGKCARSMEKGVRAVEHKIPL